MARVAISFHHDRSEARRLVHEAVKWLAVNGHEASFPREDASVAGIEAPALEGDELRTPVLALSLGGDGTMLRTVSQFVPYDVPILGVNVGQLGYLTAVQPADLATALEAFFAGNYRTEERMTLAVSVERGGEGMGATAGPAHVALNEAVVEKSWPGHTVRLGVTIGDEYFTTYVTDGLIVATPTGSTAYNLSARGPILSPDQRAIVLTAVSPHMLFDRSLVVGPQETVVLSVAGTRDATLSVDGRDLGALHPGDRVSCREGAHVARLVVFGPRDFLYVLKTKFGLPERTAQEGD